MKKRTSTPSLSLLKKETTPFGEVCFRFRHISGLTLALIPGDRAVTAAYLGVPAGTLEEAPEGRRKSVHAPAFPGGTAHFLEHKLFENEDGEDSFEKFAVYGANANAFTSLTHTVYLFTCSEKESFLPALRVLVEGFLHPCFTAESIAREREIITQEILLYEDDPETSVYAEMLRGLFGDSPVSARICGSPASISEITSETLHDFYRAFYKPEDAILTVCGNVSEKEMAPLLDELLQPVPSKTEGGAPRCVSPGKIALPPAKARVTLEKTLPMPLFCIGLRGEPLPQSGKEEALASLALFSQILFDDFLSSLYEKGVCPEQPRYDYEFTDRYGYLAFFGQAQDPEGILTRFKDRMASIAKKGISDPSLDRAKKVLYAHYLRGFDDSDGTGAEWSSFLLDGMDLFDYGKALLSVKKERLQSLAKTLAREDRVTLCAAYPPKTP